MRPIEPETDLSPQATATIQAVIAAHSGLAAESIVDLKTLVRYVDGVMHPDEASDLEISLARDPSQVHQLASTWKAVERFRRLTWQELQSLSPENEPTSQILHEWMRCISGAVIDTETPELSLSTLAALARSGLEGARIALGVVSNILEAGLAPKRPMVFATTRAVADQPLVEGEHFSRADTRLLAEIALDGSLGLEVVYPGHNGPNGHAVWVAFEANRQWLGIGSMAVVESKAALQVQGFGSLLGLSEGPLPANRFALRLDDWPSVCMAGTFIVQEGREPFASVEREPKIENGNVVVGIQLLPQNRELQEARELELWFGAGSRVWQLLGRWPLPSSLDAAMTLSCPTPRSEHVGEGFPAVLKLALR